MWMLFLTESSSYGTTSNRQGWKSYSERSTVILVLARALTWALGPQQHCSFPAESFSPRTHSPIHQRMHKFNRSL